MYEQSEQPLRELARSEPLAERARRMIDAPGPNTENGIKLVRVTVVDKAADTATLEIHFYNLNYLAAIDVSITPPAEIFAISGGTRIRGGSALGQVQVTSIAMPDPARPVLVLTLSPIGDYSTYTLSVIAPSVRNPPPPPNSRTTLRFDPLFAEIRFKFRPGCFNNNCAPEWETALPPFLEPTIDYLAKDYGSFRQTMIAAMSQRVPEWQPTSEADLDMVLAELFAVGADELSDYQDRVMNEAYLSSARKRVSLARHSRLMDYHIHQGSQASTWLAIELLHHGAGQKEFKLKQNLTVWAGESEQPLLDKPIDSSVVFLSKHAEPQTVHQQLNSMGLYSWSGSITTLRAGSTRADLRLYNRLYIGEAAAMSVPVPSGSTQAAADAIVDLIRKKEVRRLLIQEHLNPKTGKFNGRDPNKRQLLNLIAESAVAMHDPVENIWCVRVSWVKKDALKQDYCFSVDCPADTSGVAVGTVENVSLFHGNLVTVFHGREETVIFKDKETADFNPIIVKPNIPLELYYERKKFGEPVRWGAICQLPLVPLAYKQTPPGGDDPPYTTLSITVTPPGGKPDTWDEVPSLIYSDDSSEKGDHFVVETDENRRSLIRFGNGINGRELPDGAEVKCTYQFGLPLDGNVGRDRVLGFDETTVVDQSGVLGLTLRSCWNPFDVTNGIDQEPVREIIRRVPEAYRQRQLRAVTLADYVARAEEIDGVSRAAARYAWTGSWRTVQVAIDPEGTSELSYELRERVESYLNAVRLIGEDLEVRPPRFVPLDIKVVLCAEPDIWPEDLKFVLEQEFSEGWTPDGRMGFFHPDQWTFGQPLYSSQLIGRALRVKGVAHAVEKPTGNPPGPPTISVSIKRWNSPVAPVESLTGLEHNEIIRVANDPDHTELGSIRFEVKGGRQ